MPDLFGIKLGGMEVALLTFGASALVLALGVSQELSVAGLKIGAPRRPSARLLAAVIGLGLIGLAFWTAEPVWSPIVTQETVWSGAQDKQPMQVVTDGDEIYVLVANGNVYRLEPDGEVLIDNGTETRQIASAGGVLYVLKDSGNIWAILLHERGQTFSTAGDDSAEGVDGGSTFPAGEPTFWRIDPQPDTREIAVAGETLYVLKTGGDLWRRTPKPGESGFERIESVPALEQIVSSGMVLYYRTRQGDVGAFFPQPEAYESGLVQDVNEALARCGKAKWVAVDGRKLYLVDADGNAVTCIDGHRSLLFNAVETRQARQVEAFGGVAYLLTNDDEIIRFRPGAPPRQYRQPSQPGQAPITSITPAVYGCYAIQGTTVRRFSEHLRQQR